MTTPDENVTAPVDPEAVAGDLYSETTEDATATTEDAPTTEDATTEDATTEDAPKVDEKDEAADPNTDPYRGAPEAYELSEGMLPEGVELDSEVFATLTETARELDLSQDAVAKLVQTLVPKMHERAAEMERSYHESWSQEIEADPELGGANRDATEKNVAQAKSAFGNDDFNALLEGPLGSHPGIVRFLSKVGQSVSEDNIVNGNTAPSEFDPMNHEQAAAELYKE